MTLKKKTVGKKKQSTLAKESSTTIDKNSQVAGVLAKISESTKKSVDEIEKEFNTFQKKLQLQYGQGLSVDSFAKLFAKKNNVKLASQISTKGPITSCKEFNEFMEGNPEDKDTRFTLRGFLILNRHEYTRGNQDSSQGAIKESNPCMHAVLMDDTGGVDVYAWAKSLSVWEDWVKATKPKIGDLIQVTGYALGKRLSVNRTSNPTIIDGATLNSLQVTAFSDVAQYSYVHIKGIGIEAAISEGNGCPNCYATANGKERQKCPICKVPDSPIRIRKAKFTLGMEDRNDVMCDVAFPKTDKKQTLRIKRLGKKPTQYEVFGLKMPNGEVRVLKWSKMK